MGSGTHKRLSRTQKLASDLTREMECDALLEGQLIMGDLKVYGACEPRTNAASFI